MPTLNPKTASKNKVKTEDAYGDMPVSVEGDGSDVGVAKKRRVAAYGVNKGGNVIRQTKGFFTYGPMA
jgi:hypothetical protein|tara:strand:+ start:4747 stop:4950 length:204 start_codon:yes stop_codon:yes gene_type:complete